MVRVKRGCVGPAGLEDLEDLGVTAMGFGSSDLFIGGVLLRRNFHA